MLIVGFDYKFERITEFAAQKELAIFRYGREKVGQFIIKLSNAFEDCRDDSYVFVLNDISGGIQWYKLIYHSKKHKLPIIRG